MRIECCLGCGRTLEVDEKDPDFFDKVQEQGWDYDLGTLVFWCNQCEDDGDEQKNAAVEALEK